MLKKLLKELNSSTGPIHTAELSRRLGVDESALLGMIDVLVRKGALQDDTAMEQRLMEECSPQSCGTCTGAKSCPLVMEMPRTYTVKTKPTAISGEAEKKQVPL